MGRDNQLWVQIGVVPAFEADLDGDAARYDSILDMNSGQLLRGYWALSMTGRHPCPKLGWRQVHKKRRMRMLRISPNPAMSDTMDEPP